jgi:prepilin-type N-terminal cleavage/methylation domain-containing protein
VTGGHRRGFTLIEVLVALSLLGVLGAAVSGALAAGLRLQVQAARTADRTRLLAPYAVPGGPPVGALPACGDVAGDGPPVACVRAWTACDLAAGALSCGGGGGSDLLRIELDVAPASGGPRPLVVWRRAP